MIGIIKAFLWVHLAFAGLVEILVIVFQFAYMADIASGLYTGEGLGWRVWTYGLMLPGVALQALLFLDTFRFCSEPRRAAAERLIVPGRVRWYGAGAIAFMLAGTGLGSLGFPVMPRDEVLAAFVPLLAGFLFTGCCFLLIHFGKRYPGF